MMERTRETHLDGLRGCAALIVVFAHFCQMFLPAVFSPKDLNHNLGEQWFATTPLNILVHGQMAVSIFFVLSGIVLSAPFFKSKNSHWYLSAALKRYWINGIRMVRRSDDRVSLRRSYAAIWRDNAELL